jgi:hypothetical protein
MAAAASASLPQQEPVRRRKHVVTAFVQRPDDGAVLLVLRSDKASSVCREGHGLPLAVVFCVTLLGSLSISGWYPQPVGSPQHRSTLLLPPSNPAKTSRWARTSTNGAPYRAAWRAATRARRRALARRHASRRSFQRCRQTCPSPFQLRHRHSLKQRHAVHRLH